MNGKRKYKFEFLTFDRMGCPVHHGYCSTYHRLLECLHNSAFKACERIQVNMDDILIEGKVEVVSDFCKRSFIRNTWRK